MTTCSAVIAGYRRAILPAQVSQFQNNLSKILIRIVRAMLKFFNIKSNDNERKITDIEDVKEHLQQSLPPT